jgi:hypothetical protein
VSVSFDETNLVPNAGLLPAAVLAQRIDQVWSSTSGCNWPGTARTAVQSAIGDRVDAGRRAHPRRQDLG